MREFAIQANEVATQVLEGEVELDRAKVYASIVRTVAQAIGAEVQRARIARTEPNLSLSDEEDGI